MSDFGPKTIAQTMGELQHVLGTVSDTPSLDARLIIMQVLGLSMEQMICQYQKTISNEDHQAIKGLVERRLKHEPMAYILGHREFFGHDFKVNSNVLIPRPDTEILVETAISRLQLMQSFPHCGGGTWADYAKVVDVCTGSGCVGISIASAITGSQVTLTDISKDALDVAAYNAQTILGHDLSYVQGDLLAPFLPTPAKRSTDAIHSILQQISHWQGTPSQDSLTKFDMIVSNPPYLTDIWCDEVEAQVKQEPRLALAGGGLDGLHLIRNLIAQAALLLNDEGSLLLECDYRQTDDVAAIMKEHHFHDIMIQEDLAGKPRVVWGIW